MLILAEQFITKIMANKTIAKLFSVVFLVALLFLPVVVGAHEQVLPPMDGIGDEMMGGVWFWPAWLMMMAIVFGYVVWTVVGVLVAAWLWQKITKKRD